MPKDYEEFTAEAADMDWTESDKLRLMEMHLQGDLTTDDLKEFLTAEHQADYWDDFRILYFDAGDNREDMLVLVQAELETARAKDKRRRSVRQRRNSDDQQKSGRSGGNKGSKENRQSKKSLPEPEVSRNRRRGRDTSGGENPIVRFVRWFRRK